jgi:hypothetical protein
VVNQPLRRALQMLGHVHDWGPHEDDNLQAILTHTKTICVSQIFSVLSAHDNQHDRQVVVLLWQCCSCKHVKELDLHLELERAFKVFSWNEFGKPCSAPLMAIDIGECLRQSITNDYCLTKVTDRSDDVEIYSYSHIQWMYCETAERAISRPGCCLHGTSMQGAVREMQARCTK